MSLFQVWDLEVFFPGGSSSPEFGEYLVGLDSDLRTIVSQVKGLSEGQGMANAQWKTLLDAIQDVSSRLQEASAFVGCLLAQDVNDNGAKQLIGQVSQLEALWKTLFTHVDDQLARLSPADLENLLSDPAIASIAFALRERSQLAKDKLPPQIESVVNDLSVDGYHAWGELYNQVSGQIKVPVNIDGESKELSVGQAANRLADSDRAVRSHVFTQYEAAWSQAADTCASALNHLAGYRISLYQNRGWDSILKEPLEMNRISADILDAMWDAVSQAKPQLVKYLQRKAQLLGLKQLSWFDVDAPVGQAATKMTYGQAAEFILDQFSRFSPKMADFAQMAFAQRWIEAEDRPGKRAGGFCTTFSESKQSRIFMTFDGAPSTVATLAHELGHGYHSWVMRDLPHLIQDYPMNLAETASTFAEAIVADAAIKQAQTQEEKIALLEDKVSRSVAFFMNIHARFIFERNFYQERAKGLISAQDLNDLMLSAQKEAYLDSLDVYHPYFWASKLHFYLTDVPFYNFPYTFGYLFSYAVYAKALEEGPQFADRYVALLQDTGRMTANDLARKHLGVELADQDFWAATVNLVTKDISDFLALTEDTK